MQTQTSQNTAENQALYAGGFMAAFLFCALFLALSAVWQARGGAEAANAQTAFNGEWAALYEKTFDKTLYFHEASKVFWGVLNYTLFNEGREGVIIGDDGWLFTSEEFTFPRNADQNIKNNLDYIQQVHTLFQKQDIELVIALLPAKARLYKEYLGPHTFPKDIQPVYHDIRKTLQGHNIFVSDIFSVMKKKKKDTELFLHTDTHWTPAGAELAARHIADEVDNNLADMNLPATNYESQLDKTLDHEGDLLRYIPLGALQDDIGPAKDSLITLKTEKIPSDNVEQSLSADSLFGNQVIPVTLVGTSYSANPFWNFDGFLKEALGTELLNAADEGMGPFETMEKYLKDGAFKENPPQLVIWEIPERYVSVTYNLEKPSL